MNMILFFLFPLACTRSPIETNTPEESSINTPEESSIGCDPLPLESGQIALIDPNIFESSCNEASVSGLSTRAIHISTLKGWEGLRDWCVGPNNAHLLPMVNFETHEIIGAGTEMDCPKKEPIVAGPTNCEQGVLSVDVSVTHSWCFCEGTEPVMTLYIVPKGLIDHIEFNVSSTQECQTIICDCSGGEESGCIGCFNFY